MAAVDEKRLQAIEARIGRATSGPWMSHVDRARERPRRVVHGYEGHASKHDNPWVCDLEVDNHADADLICHALEDLRDLCATVRANGLNHRPRADWWGSGDGLCRRFTDGSPDEHVLSMYVLGSRQSPPEYGGGPCSCLVAGPFCTLREAFEAREKWVGSDDQDGYPVIYEVRARAGVVAYHETSLEDVEAAAARRT